MAQEAPPLFNFFHRYKWNEQDFTNWQAGMVDLNRSAFEGLFNGAVMSGFDAAPSGMGITVSPGIAVGPTGYMMIENDANSISFSAPGSDARKDLVVMRPLLTNSMPITRPTSPFDTVYLEQLQDTVLAVIQGTPGAQPEYPAKLANDVVLFGVRLYSGQSSIVDEDLDFEVRDIYGKNSIFQNNFGRYDDRCRPYRSTRKVLGIKPSQLIHPSSRGFTYVTQNPSAFPRDGSNNFANADTFLDFETGAITGGDQTSADFTPTVPTAGNAIVAAVVLKSDDTLAVTYGTEGTRNQCIDGIMNQTMSGPGSMNITSGSKLLAFVIVYSAAGSNVDEIDVIDTRSLGIAVASKIPLNVASKVFGDSPFTPDSTNDIIEFNATGGASTVTPPSAAAFTGKEFTVIKTDSSVNTVTVTGVSVLYYQSQGVTFFSDGTSWVVRSNYNPVQSVELHLDTATNAGNADHGTTNTAIRRFVNVQKNTLGNHATYADSVTLGMSVTVNIPGVYFVKYGDARSAAPQSHGISLNSSDLTTIIDSLTYAQGKRAYCVAQSGPRVAECSTTLRLAIGDVIRAHDDKTNDSTTSNVTFQMIRIAD